MPLTISLHNTYSQYMIAIAEHVYSSSTCCAILLPLPIGLVTHVSPAMHSPKGRPSARRRADVRISLPTTRKLPQKYCDAHASA